MFALPTFSDNYIWMLHNEQEAIVVDPGVATPVIDVLRHYHLQLTAILITHHHADHTGGTEELRPYLKDPHAVFGPAKEEIPQPYQPMDASSALNLLGLNIQVLDVPGHTAGHIAFYIPEQQLKDKSTFDAIVFTGDTLFSGGCGRLFEGTAQQMFTSLEQLAALPASTKIYCAHEYTLSNLRFALAVTPKDTALQVYITQCETLRAQNKPTIPSTIERELQINPFLRSHNPTIIKSVQFIEPNAKDPVEIFAALRRWKDNFK